MLYKVPMYVQKKLGRPTKKNREKGKGKKDSDNIIF